MLMITINYPVTLSISCENITKIHLTYFWCDPTSVTPYILAESHTVIIFSLSPLENLSRNKGGTFPSGSNLSLLFSSLQCTEKLKTFLYHGYYINKHKGKQLCIIQTLLL